MGTKHGMPTFRPYIPFSPLDIAGCILWLKSDTGVTKDGEDKVSAWADQSGNGHNVTSPTYHPIWYANQLNGYPGIVTQFSNDFKTANIGFTTQPYTMFFAFNGSAIDESTIYWISPLTSGQPPTFGKQGKGLTTMFMNAGSTLTVIVSDVRNIGIAYAIFDGVSSKIKGYDASSSYTQTGNAGVSTDSGGGLTIGSRADGAFYGRVRMVEYLIYENRVSDPNIELIVAYLNNKYAIF